MNFTISKLGGLDKTQINLNSSKKVNFKANSDIISFSDVAKEKSQILSELKSLGFDYEEAQNLVKEYYKTPMYYELTEGEIEDGKLYPKHFVEIERNLTPTEAIVYQAYDMDQYYVQSGDWGFPENPATTIKAQDYDLGEMNFLPLELAKNINEDIDVVLSGMILKGKIDPETALKTAKYYNVSCDKFSNYFNLKEAEYTADLISKNLEKLDYLTSDETKKEGLLRPLTDKEAVDLITNDYMPDDTASLNNYFSYNREFGFSLFDMSLKELWQKPVEEYKEELKVKKIPTKIQIETFEDAVNFVRYKLDNRHSEYLDDISQLDGDKFYKRYRTDAIKYDALMSDRVDRDLRKKNIEVLNNTSDELLNKMTSGDRNKIGHFAFIRTLLEAKDLDKRISELERYKENNPQLFDSMTKQAVMDYLTNSDFYTNSRTNYEKFIEALSGISSDDEAKTPEIIEFPFNQE